MRSVLSSWKRRLLFEKHVKPEPQSAPQIIATRVFRFVERSTELKTFKKSMKRKNVRRKKRETDAQDERRQLLESTPLTNSLPLTFNFLIASQNIPSCEYSRIDGNAIRVSQTGYMVYLKDERPPFKADIRRLMDTDAFDVRRPEIFMSYEDKSKINKRILRESKREEEEKNKMRKGEAEIARKQWMVSEYNSMVQKIKQNQHTFDDFADLFEKLGQPFVHTTNDGYVTRCTSNESVCINNMALSTIDGVLCQKRQAEELSRLNALQKKRNSTKRKQTPNTTRGDDGIGIVMGLQDHDIWAHQEERAKQDENQKKELLHLEKTLPEFDALKAKYNGTINIDSCLGYELLTLLSVCGLAKGNSGKSKPEKRKVLRDNNITNERLTVFVDDATKRLNQIQELLAGDVALPTIEGDDNSVASELSHISNCE